MPRLSRLVPALALVLALLPAAAFADGRTPRVDHREWHQQQRILGGAHSGRLTPRERVHLRHMQNDASRDIYRQKHDGQCREPRYFP